MPELVKSLANKFTGRPMVRSFWQPEAFLTQIIPSDSSTKAAGILADKRNYQAAKEFAGVQHTFLNSSKNLRQQMNDDKYNMNTNRCKLYMDYKTGIRKDLGALLDYESAVYFCCSLYVVTRTNVDNQGNLNLILYITEKLILYYRKCKKYAYSK